MRKTKSKQPPARMISPVNLPAQIKPLKAALLRSLSRVMDSGRFILGPETQTLEREIARRSGARFALGVNSGTDALILALRALNIGPGDEVIVPDYSFVATASAVMLAGAKPVLADVEPETLCLDPRQAEKRLTRRTRAIIAVHLYGQPADMTRLRKLARAARIFLIEDNAQALDATWQGRPVGALGDLGCLSFFPTKNLGGLGDGGMVLTNNARLAERVKRLRQHGENPKYYHHELGLNSRLDEVQAAALRIKLPRLSDWNRRRQSIAGQYNRAFKNLPLTLPRVRPGATHVYHQYTLRLENRDALQRHLREHGIASAIHYPLPIHAQPMLKPLVPKSHRFPVSDEAARQVLSLPVVPELTATNVQHIIQAVRAFFQA